MHIRWYGQSAFLLSGEKTVMIDPFGPLGEQAAARGIVFEYPAIEPVDADLLLITHEHADHSAAELATGSPTVIRSTAGTFDSPVGEVAAVASEHDDVAGTTRGPNTIFRFSLDGLRVCHLGDLGQPALRPEQVAAIGEVDVLFVPSGGGPTVGGDAAAEVVRALASSPGRADALPHAGNRLPRPARRVPRRPRCAGRAARRAGVRSGSPPRQQRPAVGGHAGSAARLRHFFFLLCQATIR